MLTRLPTWVIVANTLLFEAALLVALFLLVVRTAERPRRARWVFVASLVLLVSAHAMAALDLRGRRTEKVTRFSFKSGSASWWFTFQWSESPVFGRTSARRFFALHGGGAGQSPLAEFEWVNTDGPPVYWTSGLAPLRTIHLGQEEFAAVWPYHDRPDEDADAGRALFDVVKNY